MRLLLVDGEHVSVSFFGKVKKATGIGLDGAESYERAFEKGVLLGNREAAAGMFRDAATKLEHDGDTVLTARAIANARLYEFLARPDASQLTAVRDAIGAVPQIEQIGSQSEFMPTAPLVEELSIRIIESQVPDSPPQAAAAGHDRAKKALESILDRKLILYRLAPLPDEGLLVDTAISRYHWHHGMSSYNSALGVMASSPSEAANYAVAAVQAFQQCGDAGRRADAEQMAHNMQVRRSCWMCHREMQGLGLYINWYPSTITSYIPALLERANQDTGSIDLQSNRVILCTPCASVVQKEADRVAQQRVQEVRNELTARIDQLQQWVQNLERKSHTH